MYKALTTLLSIVLLLGVTTVVAGPAPQLINYQAALEDSNGDPVTSQVTVTFRIYDAATSKAILWEETRSITPDANGMFSVNLGEVTPVSDAVFSSSQRWLGVTVGSDSEITPRTQLASAPYSMRVETIDQAEAGTIRGPLVIDESVQRSLPYIELVSSGSSESVKICASACPVMSATNESGNEVLTLSMGSSSTPALFVVKGPGGDDDNQAMFGSGGTELYVPDGRGLLKSYSLTSESGFEAFSSVDSTDVLVSITENATTCGGEIEVSGCSFGKGNVSTVRIAPAEDEVLSAVNSSGDPMIELSTADASGKIVLSNPAKAGNRVEIREDGIYFFDATRQDTTMVISADGSIRGKGTVSMGQNISNDDWCNVMGINNTAAGDSSGILAGFSNSICNEGTSAIINGGSNNSIVNIPAKTASPINATIGGGALNVTGGRRSVICGGAENTIEHQYGAILGGKNNFVDGFAATVACGENNSARGSYSAVTGGINDTIAVGANRSMAFGENVLVEEEYRVVLFDGSTSGRVAINRDNDGSTTIDYPVHVGTDASNGNAAYLTSGGVWTIGTGKNFNKSLGLLDGQDVLERVDQLSIELRESDVTGEKHLLPDVASFQAQFDVGTITKDGSRDSEHLAAADMAGVALVGVQELYRMLQEQQQLAQKLQEKDKKIEELELRLTQMETLVEAVLAQRENNAGGSDELALNK